MQGSQHFDRANNSASTGDYLQETPSNYSLNESPINPEDFILLDHVLLVPTGLVVLAWLLILLNRLHLWKSMRHRITTLKRLPQIPCANCRFFKDNPYLKCAVHPATVLKAEASNCSDFWPRQSQFFHKH